MINYSALTRQLKGKRVPRPNRSLDYFRTCLSIYRNLCLVMKNQMRFREEKYQRK